MSTDPRLDAWIDALLETPGLTAIRDRAEAWRVHVEDSLTALPLLRGFPGPLVDVGSGGGSPGIPLAAALPDRQFTLLEANGRRCEFLERTATAFPNVRVVNSRAEEQGVDVYGVAVAKALAPPVVAAEWCLPLVAPGGAAILYTGADVAGVEHAAAALAADPPVVHEVEGSPTRRLVVLRKHSATPPGFPRRPGMARKRPLR